MKEAEAQIIAERLKAMVENAKRYGALLREKYPDDYVDDADADADADAAAPKLTSQDDYNDDLKDRYNQMRGL